MDKSLQVHGSTERVLIASLVLGATVVFMNVFRWTLTAWLTEFVELFLELIIGAGFLAVTAWSIAHVIRVRETVGLYRAAVPLIINITAFLIVLLVPFTEITTSLDFRWKYSKRDEVARAVMHGEMDRLLTNGGGRGEFIHLPPKYRGLSADGDNIIVFRRGGHVLILFLDFRGILNHFSGFVYSSDDVRPENGDFGGSFAEVERFQANWYWVTST